MSRLRDGRRRKRGNGPKDGKKRSRPGRREVGSDKIIYEKKDECYIYVL